MFNTYKIRVIHRTFFGMSAPGYWIQNLDASLCFPGQHRYRRRETDSAIDMSSIKSVLKIRIVGIFKSSAEILVIGVFHFFFKNRWIIP